jgi:WD40 repeat protein
VASDGRRGVLQFDLATREVRLLHPYGAGQAGVLSEDRLVAVSADGRWLAAEGAGGQGVHLCDRRSGEWRPLLGPSQVVGLEAMCFTPDHLLAVSEEDGAVRLWDTSGRPLGTLHIPQLTGWSLDSPPRPDHLASVIFSPDAELVAFQDAIGRIAVWPWRRLLGGEGHP